MYDDMWLESVGNGPDKLMMYINVSSPLDRSVYFMFRVLHNQGRDIFLCWCQHTIPEEHAISGSTNSVPMRDALAHISGSRTNTVAW
jgi:hypothetical protein